MLEVLKGGEFCATVIEDIFRRKRECERLLRLLNGLLKKSRKWSYEKKKVVNGDVVSRRCEEVEVDFFFIDCSGVGFKTAEGQTYYFDDLNIDFLRWQNSCLTALSPRVNGWVGFIMKAL